jgi:hypothetical protein
MIFCLELLACVAMAAFTIYSTRRALGHARQAGYYAAKAELLRTWHDVLSQSIDHVHSVEMEKLLVEAHRGAVARGGGETTKQKRSPFDEPSATNERRESLPDRWRRRDAHPVAARRVRRTEGARREAAASCARASHRAHGVRSGVRAFDARHVLLHVRPETRGAISVKKTEQEKMDEFLEEHPSAELHGFFRTKPDGELECVVLARLASEPRKCEAIGFTASSAEALIEAATCGGFEIGDVENVRENCKPPRSVKRTKKEPFR